MEALFEKMTRDSGAASLFTSLEKKLVRGENFCWLLLRVALMQKLSSLKE